MSGSRGGGGLDRPGNSHVGIGFLRNTGTDTPREAIGPLGPIPSLGRSVRPSVKYVDHYKNIVRTPLAELSGSAH